jgi:UDP-N-acetylmuramoyl-tripeptide--D-alanyl-D-alanine ligase
MEARQKIVILGDMFELGSQSFEEHQSIIDLAQKLEFSTTLFGRASFF